MLLRFVALAGLLVFFLGIERRTTREVVHNSQVAVLVDVSQSMGLSEDDNADRTSAHAHRSSRQTRSTDSPLIAELRQTHDVNIARFDQEVEPVVTLPKSQESRVEGQEPEASESSTSYSGSRPSTLDSRLHRLVRRAPAARHGNAAGAGAGRSVAAVSRRAARRHDRDFRRRTKRRRRTGAAVEAARQAKVPLYTIGVGSTESQRNIALRDLVVPTRAFPGDTLNVTGYLQANGYAGQSVEVELTRRRTRRSGRRRHADRLRARRARPGRRNGARVVRYRAGRAGHVRVSTSRQGPPDDGNPRDNQREAEVEVVDRKTRVLLFASGPMRDYQFLRNQLFRDRTMTVDVLAANGPARHLAGSEQDPRPFPEHGRGAVPIRLHRGVRSRLDGARCRAGRAAGKVGLRRSGRTDRGRRADSNAASGSAAPNTRSCATCIRSCSSSG